MIRMLNRRAAMGLAGFAVMSAFTQGADAMPSGDPYVARILYQEWKARRTSEKVLLAMFEAACVESGVRNLRYGDRDSMGVFQIRTSIWGWSTATNVSLSARWFLNRAIPRQWYYSTAGRLAQAVEVSSFPWRYDQTYSWASAWIRYVRGTTTSTSTSARVLFRARVTSGPLNVRTGPGTGYRIVGSLGTGTTVNVYGTSGSWYKILYGGYYRWIAGGYTRRV